MSPRAEQRARVTFWVALVAVWIVAAWYMFDAAATVPSADRLAQDRMVEIPTPSGYIAAVIMSGLELALVLAILWPWRPELYASRLAFAALALITWFIMTTQIDVSRMDWIHRRWLASTILLQLLGIAVLLLYRAGRRIASQQPHNSTGR